MAFFLFALLNFLPDKAFGIKFDSKECEDVYAFPKIIGRNNSGFNTSVYELKYNEFSDRTAVSALTNDPEKCPGVSKCHFISMY